MEDIVQLIESLGGLHDARISALRWMPDTRSLEIEVKDLYSNFDGLPEYEGPTRAKFVFSDVSKAVLEVDFADACIYDWTFTKSGTPNCIIHFFPGGRITIECGQIECVKSPN